MLEKRLAEIQARKMSIRLEIEEATTEELEGQLDKLEKEAEELEKEEEEVRRKLNMQRTRGGTPAHKPSATPEMTDAEARGRDLRQQRAVTIAGDSLVKPVGTQDSINGLLGRNVSSIVDLVKMTDMVGLQEYQVPYVKEESRGEKTAENTDAPAGDVVFDYAVIKPVTVAIYSEISREATKLNDGAYYNTVIEAARKALRKKVANYIVNSDATTSPTFIGILSAPAITAASDVELKTIDATTLRKITMQYGGDEDVVGEGVLFLNKKDLIALGDIRGTNEKKAVYEITPDTENTNTGIIKDGGLAVRYCINGNATALADAAVGKYSMIYGIPTCFECGVFSDYTVRVSEDAAFRRRMIAVLGEVMIGGNVVIKDGFVRVKKGA